MTSWWPWGDWLVRGINSVVLAAGVIVMLMAWRRARPAHALPIRMIGTLIAAAITCLLSVLLRVVTGPGDIPDRLWTFGLFVLLPAALVLYPDDKPTPGLGWTSVVVVTLVGALGVAHPDTYIETNFTILAVYLLLLALQWWRYEHTDDSGRRALLWLALGAMPGPLLANIAFFALSGAIAIAVGGAVWVVFVACLVIGLVAPD